MRNNHLSREIQELYSREQELPRNVISTDTMMICDKRPREKWPNGKRRKKRPFKTVKQRRGF